MGVWTYEWGFHKEIVHTSIHPHVQTSLITRKYCPAMKPKVHGSKCISTLALLLLAVALMPAVGYGQQVMRHPQPEDALSQKWQWAEEQARQDAAARRGYWVGYSIERLMEEEALLMVSEDFTLWNYGSVDRDGRSLYEHITGAKPPVEQLSEDEAVRREAERALARFDGKRRPGKKVWKEIAVLFQYTARAKGPADIASIWLGNVEFAVDLEGRPLLWLGAAEDAESIALLQQYYAQAQTVALQEPLVEAIGAHSRPDLVVPFLQEVLASRVDDEVREEAASWLAYQDDERVVDILVGAARTDRSVEVREEAVEAIACHETEAATDALIDLARTVEVAAVREEAVESLGALTSPRVVEALEALAFDDPKRTIQEEAVEALAEFPSATATPVLTRIVKTHDDPQIREEAIELLGEVAPVDNVLTTLEWVAFQDKSSEVQEEAVEVLAELPGGSGIPVVVKIAQSHPRSSIREEAIDYLDESEDARAKEGLKTVRRKD